MTQQFTQGQRRLKQVNYLCIGIFIGLVLLGEIFFSVLIKQSESHWSLSLLWESLRFMVPIALAVAFYLRRVIKFIYVRETSQLAEGFYSQRSWLDVDDKVMVYTQNNELVFYEIPEDALPMLQQAYQQGQPFEDLADIAGVKHQDIQRIDMQNIVCLSSSHKTDTIDIETEDDIHSVEFLNVATKNHALKRFALMLNDHMQLHIKRPNRLQASRAWLITLVVFAALMAIIHNLFLWAFLIAVGLLYILPKLLKELIDPTQTTLWRAPE